MWRKLMIIMMIVIVEEGFAQPPDTLWSVLLEGRGNFNGMTAVQTADGGFAFCSKGWIGLQERRDTDFFLSKLDSTGGIEWSALYDGFRNDIHSGDVAHSISLMPDKGYILGGNSGSEGMVVRTDSSGNRIWTKILPYEDGFETVYGLAVSDNGNILVACAERVAMLSDSLEGEVMWYNNYIEGNFTGWSTFLNIGGGEFLLGGATADTGSGGFDMCVAKINQDGDLLWLHFYGSELSENGTGIAPDLDGGFFLAGTYRFDGGSDSTKALVIKIDSEGVEEWTRIYDEYPSGDGLYEVVPTLDGGFTACGETGTEDYLLMRFDSSGEVLWRKVWDIRGINRCYDLLALEGGGYFLTGAASNDAWLIRTGPDPANNSVVLLYPAFPSQFVVGAPYPNPFNSTMTITFGLVNGPYAVSIYGLDGRLVAQFFGSTAVSGGRFSHPAAEGGATGKFIWNAAGFPAGEYFIRLQSGREEAVRKVVLVR